MHLPRQPRVSLAIFVQDTAGPDEARGVEHMTRPLGIDLKERTGLNINAQFLRLFLITVGVLIRDWQGETLDQFFNSGINRSRVSKFRESDEADIKKRLVAGHGKIDHVQHAFCATMNLIP